MTDASLGRVRNLEASNIQITAEQLINEARVQFSHINEITKSLGPTVGGVSIIDKDEMASYLQRKRKEYEDKLRITWVTLRHYLEYARFEANNDDYKRMRSIMERAIVKYAYEVKLWLTYAEIEAKGGFTNYALNVMVRGDMSERMFQK